MSAEIKQALEELKDAVAALATAQKSGDEDKAKMEKILEDVQAKQKELEAKRKGSMTEDPDEDPDKGLFQFKATGSLDALLKMPSIDDGVKTFQEASDDILIVSQLLGVDPRETAIYKHAAQSNPILAKAMSTSGNSEWIPTGYSPRLFDRIRLQLKVAGLHETMAMPTATYKPPVVTSDMTGYLVSERTGDDDALTAGNRYPASSPGTSNFTLTAKKLAGRVVFSEEMSEDSIVPVLPLVRNNIVLAIATAIENAIINGDTDATHMDSDTTSANDARKAWDGYRKLAPAAAKVSLATFNADNLLSIRKAMGKYGVNPMDLAWVVGVSGYAQMLNVVDANNNQLVTTLDKYGPSATILQGELGKIWGTPIIVSEYIRENLNATGVYDGTTTTKTEILCVFRPGCLLGDRRTLKIKTAEEITTDQTILVATVRKAFATPYSGEKIVGVGYNLTT